MITASNDSVIYKDIRLKSYILMAEKTFCMFKDNLKKANSWQERLLTFLLGIKVYNKEFYEDMVVKCEENLKELYELSS